MNSSPGSHAIPNTHKTRSAVSLRFRLRDGTQDAHQRLDSAIDSVDLWQPRERALFCTWMEGGFAVLEHALRKLDTASVYPDWAPMLPGEISDSADTMPGLADDQATAAGLLYVHQGSRLGGRALARLFPPLADEAPALFNDETSGWRSFLSSLERLRPDDAFADRALDAARLGFDVFARRMPPAFLKGATSPGYRGDLR